MTNPSKDRTDKNPAHQTGENEGKIKKPQQTDATMAEEDLPRGSERENLDRSSSR